MDRTSARFLLIILGATAGCTQALADGFLDAYVGAAFGQSHLRTDKEIVGETGSSGLLEGNHSAWSLMTGIRPIQPLGVELQYLDFGHLHRETSGVLGGISEVEAKAGTLSALGFLPLPVPFLDVYGRLGAARLHESTAEVGPTPFLCPLGIPVCGPSRLNISNRTTNIVYGAGVQGKLGSLGIRVEYERIAASNENPRIASLGVSWKF
jgi:OmpA-like transmembrane domain